MNTNHHTSDEDYYDDNVPTPSHSTGRTSYDDSNDDSEVTAKSSDSNSKAKPTGEYPSKRRFSIWSYVKGLVSKFHWPSFNSEPPVPTDNGPYQPFADRAVCLSSYGIVGRGLGEGVSSHVYLLRKTPNHQSLAVKVFRKCKKRVNRIHYMKALVNEFAVTYTLHHKHVLHTIDFVKMDDNHNKFGLIMEYCEQGDLSTLICKRELQPEEIYAYFKQLMSGLKYLHDSGVAHRDLKPENLLLQNSILKIADFGSCHVFRSESETNDRKSSGIVGTTPYIAPEVFTDLTYWGTIADVWSAGIVFFTMHYSGVPFNSAERKDSEYRLYLRAFEDKRFIGFSEMPKEPQKLLYSMLHPDPELRITVSEIINSPWMQGVNAYYVRECDRRWRQY
ncbi:kinase-like protein [Rhizopus microsporus var. microsporus]|uniref:Kinase-like protein n=2 Tax=Rhizopus microsporus TaxID=58291 RepID=A0A2G4T026_RHIZD|nr:kinase-like protein [Rhizopus microsporus ATCC 52813]ORE11765.1 kinase-like protein [Rhizopus microsporus var. microsporus]PHZ14016.1 kinase-like protein [Rhizopus microsporus ATCC 52813]